MDENATINLIFEALNLSCVTLLIKKSISLVLHNSNTVDKIDIIATNIALKPKLINSYDTISLDFSNTKKETANEIAEQNP